MSEEVKPVRWWNRPLPMSRLFIALLGVIFLCIAVLTGPFLVQALWAVIAGWLFHGIRVLPEFVGKWQAAILPVSMVFVAWWLVHGFLRWYLQASDSRLAGRWTFLRSGALLALVLFGAAAAVSISGVAHQAMWLGQTKWTETSGLSSVRKAASSMIYLSKLMFLHDVETGRLPASMDELMEFVVEIDMADSISIQTMNDGGLYVPMLTKPGAVLAELPSKTIVLLSNPVEGLHQAILANGAWIRMTPEELDEIIARGDWIHPETP